ncbi:hypothetical protein D3C76_1718980 [compost metagenome]
MRERFCAEEHVRVADYGRLNPKVAQGAFHEPVEIGGEDDPNVPTLDQCGHGAMCCSGHLQAAFKLIFVRL